MGTAMTGWWRRNALALGAVAVLLPATALTIGLQEWNDYFSGQPSAPIHVAAGDSVEFAGATWGPVRSSFANDTTGLDMPADAELFIAAVPVDPGADAAGCLPPTLVEAGTSRQWNESTSRLGLPYRADEPTSCVPDAEEPYTIYVPFVIPSDAAGPFWVDVSSAETLPEFLRFELEP